MNKKGQGMSTNTIILLILGLVILVALIYGFSTGFEAFKSETGKTNVDEVVEQCKTSCSLNQKFGFCNTDVEVRIQEEELSYKTSCGALATVPEFARMGVRECAKIECSVPCTSVRVNDEVGKIYTELKDGFHDVTAYASDVNDGEYCLIPRA